MDKKPTTFSIKLVFLESDPVQVQTEFKTETTTLYSTKYFALRSITDISPRQWAIFAESCAKEEAFEYRQPGRSDWTTLYIVSDGPIVKIQTPSGMLTVSASECVPAFVLAGATMTNCGLPYYGVTVRSPTTDNKKENVENDAGNDAPNDDDEDHDEKKRCRK